MTHPERKDTLGKNGKRLALLKEEEQRAWFDRKAVANGFIVDFDSLRVAKPINRYFYKNGIRGNHIGVRFTGVLSVTDKDLFAKAFSHGAFPTHVGMNRISTNIECEARSVPYTCRDEPRTDCPWRFAVWRSLHM